MFWVDDDNNIHLSIGDTASFYIEADAYYEDDEGTQTPFEFSEDDRALWTVKNSAGNVVFERAYPLAGGDLPNGTFMVSLRNSDTDTLLAGNYSWDVRYIIHPYYDEQGRIYEGDQVITPEPALTTQLLSVVGEV